MCATWPSFLRGFVRRLSDCSALFRRSPGNTALGEHTNFRLMVSSLSDKTLQGLRGVFLIFLLEPCFPLLHKLYPECFTSITALVIPLTKSLKCLIRLNSGTHRYNDKNTSTVTANSSKCDDNCSQLFPAAPLVLSQSCGAVIAQRRTTRL